MSSGRRDYTWGALQDVIQPGQNNSNYYKRALVTTASLAEGTAISYTVPAGYKFFLTGVFVSVNTPQFVHMAIRKETVPFFNANFELNYSFNPGVWGAYGFDEGELLEVLVQNYDTVTVSWYVEMFGILEELV